MTDFSEEQRAEIIRQYHIRKLPLEEALAYATKPVYGLTEEVFGLQHESHNSHITHIEYRSPLYTQYAFRNNRTFVIKTRIFEEKEKVMFGVFSSAIEAALVDATVCPIPDSEPFANLFAAKAKSLRVVAENATLSIDGKQFNGKVMHYTAPVRYSRFTLYSERVGIQGEALGPSLEELIQIVESLHDLNGKAVE